MNGFVHRAVILTAFNICMNRVMVTAVILAVCRILMGRMVIRTIIGAVRRILMNGVVVTAVILTALRILVVVVVVRAVSSRVGISSAAVMSAAMVPMSHDRRYRASDTYKSSQDCRRSFFPVLKKSHLHFLPK